MNFLGICKDYEPGSIISIKITKLKEKQIKNDRFYLLKHVCEVSYLFILIRIKLRISEN